MLLTMGKAGGIISKLSPKNMGNAAMAVRHPPQSGTPYGITHHDN